MPDRSDVEQAGQGGDRARCVARLQTPDAEPVQAFTGHDFKRLGLVQRMRVPFSWRRCGHFVESREIEPGQPVVRLLDDCGGEFFGEFG